MKINGHSVIDAKKPVKIRITTRDCRVGGNKDPGACAAARAVLREIPDATQARIHISRAYIQNSKGTWTRYLTSPALRTELVAFDRGGAFEPGEYILSPIPKTLKLGTKFVAKAKAKSKAKQDRNFGGGRKVVKNVRPRGANR